MPHCKKRFLFFGLAAVLTSLLGTGTLFSAETIPMQPMDHSGHENHETGDMDDSMEMLQADPKEWVQEQSGKYIPLDAQFVDETGKQVSLGQLIDRPTLLLPVYYSCPKACSFDMANLAEAVRASSIPYSTFHVITLSFNEEESPEFAAAAKPNYTELLGDDFPQDSWTFLTGDLTNIRRVTSAIGYRFKRLEDGLFIHPSAMVALGKDGKIIKYIYGSFLSGDVDLALTEAEKGTPATSIRRFINFCFNYSPTQNQKVFTWLKLGTLTLLGIGCIYFVFFFLKKRE